MWDIDDEDVGCHHSGVCVAHEDAKLICNCIYCGKELHEIDGDWWTWDADQHPSPKPQQQMSRRGSAITNGDGK